jgi:phage/plasmid-like protein (TIGR03299 family)
MSTGLDFEKAYGPITIVGPHGKGMVDRHVRGWDGGRFVPGDCKTTAEALAATGLDWTVQKHPILKVDSILGVSADGSPETIGWQPRKGSDVAHAKHERKNDLVPGGFDIVRGYTMNVRQDTGDVLGIVGPQWKAVQNHEAFSFVDSLVDSGDAKWLGGGMKGNGEKIWMCAQLERGVALGGDEAEYTLPLLFLQNGWDGYMSLTTTVAPYRLSCLNGQTMPIPGFARSWKIRHTQSIVGKIAEARRALELSIGYFDAWTVEMEKLMTVKSSRTFVDKALVSLFPDATDKAGEIRPRAQRLVEERRDAVKAIYLNAPDLQHLGKTHYRFLNAVTDFADWHTSDAGNMLVSAEPSALKDKAYALCAAA